MHDFFARGVAHGRGAFRLMAFLLWAFFCCGRLAALLSVTPRGLHVRLRGLHTQKWALGAMRFLGMRLRLRGEPPPAPCLVVSNHLGYLDIVALVAAFPAVFVSKAEVRHWPLLGMLARLNGSLFVDRNRPRDAVRINGQLHALHSEGAAIVLFPEGTSSDGRTVHPFKPALLDSAAKFRWPVHAAHLRYRCFGGASAVSASTALCWHGDMAFFPHFWAMLSRPGFMAEIAFAPLPLRSGDRRLLAEELRAQVLDLRPGSGAKAGVIDPLKHVPSQAMAS